MLNTYTNENIENLSTKEMLDRTEKRFAKQYKFNKENQIPADCFVMDLCFSEINQEIIDELDALNVEKIMIADDLFDTHNVELLMNNGWKFEKIDHVFYYKELKWEITGAVFTKSAK